MNGSHISISLDPFLFQNNLVRSWDIRGVVAPACNTMTEVVHFTAQQTRDNLCMSELVRVVERGLGNFSEKDGGVLQPVRMVLPVDNTNDLPSG